jgi:hypothetical protein
MANEKQPTPNDQRSVVKNSNNEAFEFDLQNRVKLEHLTPQEAQQIKEGKKKN